MTGRNDSVAEIMHEATFIFRQNHAPDDGDPNSLALLMATRFNGLAEQGQTQKLESGAMLMAEGQQATDLYIVLDGQMEVMARIGQDWIRVAELGPGSAIGEMAFLDGSPRSARVFATTPCSLLQITRESFEKFSQQRPDIAISFILELGRIVAFRLRRLEQFDTAEVSKEYERKALAAELHDQTLADLGGLAVELGFLANKVSGYSEELRQSVDQLRERLKETDQGLRDIVQGIFPPVLTIMGLLPAINSFLSDISGRPVASVYPIEVRLSATGFDKGRLEESLEISLYRVIQQGLANVIQHAQAKQVSIDLSWSDDEVILVLADDGVGFDLLNPKESQLTGHYGLSNLKDRIEKHLGRMEIMSQPGKGTTLRAKIPIVGAESGTTESHVSTYSLHNQPVPEPTT
ncbi:MAG: cyclic nucleotide-binding domain-containing protein [Chloroflexi bacterium]|nr:cyclic nucleotide-binding domain-containing protein [Chloroflexota bacterium]